jgi:F-type H+-transporting ATPase subunit c
MKNITKNFALVLAATLFAVPAFAQEAAAGGLSTADGMKAIAAAIAISIAALGGALGQGKAAATALDGIARNPAAADKIFTPMIIGLALIESLVIYALVIALKLANFF